MEGRVRKIGVHVLNSVSSWLLARCTSFWMLLLCVMSPGYRCSGNCGYDVVVVVAGTKLRLYVAVERELGAFDVFVGFALLF